MTDLTDTLARRAAERELDGRRAARVEEMRRIVAAAYRVIERSGEVDLTLRDLLAEAGISTQAFYRHFHSKDELLLVLLDDGCRQLAGYLAHRMDAQASPGAAVAAWIEGVLAQAADTDAAARTRPFVAHQDRLAELFPDEQRASVDLLVDLLVGPLAAGGRVGGDRARRDAVAVYHLAFGALRAHLVARTRPSTTEINHLVRFATTGTGVR